MLPNVTSDENQQTDSNKKLIGAYDKYLTYCALGGLLTDEEGRLTKITQDDFCEMQNVSKMTLWRWKQEQGFAMKVRARREEVVPLARETAAFNRLYMIGMSGKGQPAVTALNTYLGHFSKLQLPVQRQDVKVEGGFADLIIEARRRGIIEGEVVDGSQPDTTGSGTNPQLQSPAS